ncbi:hypothetical protein HanXRQr2_Chr05g0201441 [Helianthus annuus]|uniref:Uncharacterized protein n=1 Tax=Helianthus annuus TaxID=4232 RepID=A0A251URI8_HELAN|nr:hypothetical protein HanXRQr2_Chr05g0201441 [Helianthus annuus]KAJ0921672.1 hypothetical protein HanPSC8_Chr05g0194311 [Helianthus annuus]
MYSSSRAIFLFSFEVIHDESTIGGNNVINTLGCLRQVNCLLGNTSDDTRTRVIRNYTFNHFSILELDYWLKPSSL